MAGKYDTHILPYLDKIAEYVDNGLSQEQIAKNLGVAYSTFRKHVKQEAALSAALEKHARARDEVVENTLYKRCTGTYATVKKQFKLRRVEYDETTGKKKREYEELVEGEEQVYVPPDTTAQIFWLVNHMKDKYTRNPQEMKLKRETFRFRKKQAEKDDF